MSCCHRHPRRNAEPRFDSKKVDVFTLNAPMMHQTQRVTNAERFSQTYGRRTRKTEDEEKKITKSRGDRSWSLHKKTAKRKDDVLEPSQFFFYFSVWRVFLPSPSTEKSALWYICHRQKTAHKSSIDFLGKRRGPAATGRQGKKMENKNENKRQSAGVMCRLTRQVVVHKSDSSCLPSSFFLSFSSSFFFAGVSYILSVIFVSLLLSAFYVPLPSTTTMATLYMRRHKRENAGQQNHRRTRPAMFNGCRRFPLRDDPPSATTDHSYFFPSSNVVSNCPGKQQHSTVMKNTLLFSKFVFNFLSAESLAIDTGSKVKATWLLEEKCFVCA